MLFTLLGLVALLLRGRKKQFSDTNTDQNGKPPEVIGSDGRGVENWGEDVPQTPCCSKTKCNVDVPQTAGCLMVLLNVGQEVDNLGEDVPQTAGCSKTKGKDAVPKTVDVPQPSTQIINSFKYEIGEKLAEGFFVNVYAATAVKGGLQVAIKCVNRWCTKFVSIVGHPKPLPKEIALHILASRGPRVNEIIQLRDWEVTHNHYLMVLERPMPCETLREYVLRNINSIDEDTTRKIMYQATVAAQTCCQRGVFHGNITMDNFLINPDNLELKLIDFGCAEFLTDNYYTDYKGKYAYHPPEYFWGGRYRGKPATVWSLGRIMFAMIFKRFPRRKDIWNLKSDAKYMKSPSRECLHVLCCSLETMPEDRIELEQLISQNWYKTGCSKTKGKDAVPKTVDVPQPSTQIINSFKYEIGEKLAEGSYGIVYAATAVKGGLQVAIKCVSSRCTKFVSIVGHPEPLPKEIALHILVRRGPRVNEIIQLRDWEVRRNHYLMVLERPMPCETLRKYVLRNINSIDEDTTRKIMYQATVAAQTCCQRGVFHGNITMDNFLINPDNLELKLIDFGRAEILTDDVYMEYKDTRAYRPPEYFLRGRYHGKPAKVWSLGMILFAMLFKRFPTKKDIWNLRRDTKYMLSPSRECRRVLCHSLEILPESRIELEQLISQNWYKILRNKETAGCSKTKTKGKDAVPKTVDVPQPSTQIINSFKYEIGEKLAEGSYGIVYAATAVTVGLQVAIKCVNSRCTKFVSIVGHPKPLPMEIALDILISRGPRVNEIIQVRDWEVKHNHYLLVLERPMPCETLREYVLRNINSIDEDTTRKIMYQATVAAQTCCQRGVFHGNITMDNFLINPDNIELKLIDFGCGEILTDDAYREYKGTGTYCPPEYFLRSRYHGKPATVWSLGMILFAMLFKRLPTRKDILNLRINTEYMLRPSRECLHVLCRSLETMPEDRIELEQLISQNWYKTLRNKETACCSKTECNADVPQTSDCATTKSSEDVF